MGKCTYIHGNGSNVHCDTAGEIVDLNGMDCSSLIGGPINWEHKSDLPAQIVGKVVDYKKIFSEQDCENEHHKYFWDKCQVPYLYVLARLYDDKKDSAKEVAALFLDDAEHPDEQPAVGFSIEGSKISKNGMTIEKSIARKVTVTSLPANKACIAQIYPQEKQATGQPDSIFKSEYSIKLDLAKSEDAPVKKSMPQGWKTYKKTDLNGKLHVESRHPEHGTISTSYNSGTDHYETRHNGLLTGLKGVWGTHKEAKDSVKHHKDYAHALTNGTVVPKVPTTVKCELQKALSAGSGMAAPQSLSGGAVLANENLDKKIKKSDDSKGFANRNDIINPANIPSKGFAIGKTKSGKEVFSHEKVHNYKNFSANDHKEAAGFHGLHAKVANSGKDYKASDFHAQKSKMHEQAAMSAERKKNRFKSGPKTIAAPNASAKDGKKNQHYLKKSEKSKDLKRAEQEYKSWSKREAFESFMSKKMPHLTKGEITAIGQTIALRKALRIEKKLAKIMDMEEAQGSFIQKKEKSLK